MGVALGERSVSMRVAAGEFGVRVCSYEEILEIEEDGHEYGLAALVDPLLRDGRLDRGGLHLVVPMLRNGYSADSKLEGSSYRCYLWFLESGKNRRKCVLVDITEDRIGSLRRLDLRNLEKVVLNLIGELPIETL